MPILRDEPDPGRERRGDVAGTGLAIVRKELANVAPAIASHRNWVDLFQLAVDSGLTVYATPFDSQYFNVNTQEDLDALRGYLSNPFIRNIPPAEAKTE